MVRKRGLENLNEWWRMRKWISRTLNVNHAILPLAIVAKVFDKMPEPYTF